MHRRCQKLSIEDFAVCGSPLLTGTVSARRVGDALCLRDLTRDFRDRSSPRPSRAADRTPGRPTKPVDIESHPPVRRSRRSVVDRCRVEGGQILGIPLLREDVRLEPVERRGERDARFPPLARGQQPKRRVLSQSLGVVGILVPRSTLGPRGPVGDSRGRTTSAISCAGSSCRSPSKVGR